MQSDRDNWFTTYTTSGIVTITPGTSRACFRVPEMNRNVYEELGREDAFVRVPANSKLEHVNVAPFSYEDVKKLRTSTQFFNVGLVSNIEAAPPSDAYKIYGEIAPTNPANPAVVAQNVALKDISVAPLYVTPNAMEPVPMSTLASANTTKGMFVCVQFMNSRNGIEQAVSMRESFQLLCTISYRAMRHLPYLPS